MNEIRSNREGRDSSRSQENTRRIVLGPWGLVLLAVVWLVLAAVFAGMGMQ